MRNLKQLTGILKACNPIYLCKDYRFVIGSRKLGTSFANFLYMQLLV